MKNVLIASFDMEVGGVERSLINMLEIFNYEDYSVDLMLYRHQGDFMKLLPKKHNLLKEISEYATFRKPISDIFMDKKLALGVARLFAKYGAIITGLHGGVKETGCYQMQLMWKYSLPFLPRLDKKYDIAISYLWPHYFVANKVVAKKKVGWIHTDFSTINTDIKMDLEMWGKFNGIVAVSEHCKDTFLDKYPTLKSKTVVVENITSPKFVRIMAEEGAKEIEFDIHNFNLLTVARLSYAKGIDNAVMALKILRDRGMEKVKWYVVGYGGDEGMIRELIAKNKLENSFILLGKKLNPYPYIKSCDLYVQPSRYEGKAVAVTEAQIIGKPVLITNYPTGKSQVRNGVDGIITDLSAEGIAEGIERIYYDDDLRKLLIKNCNITNYSNIHEMDKLYDLISN